MAVDIVESFIPGRIRLRSSLLRDAETGAMVRAAFEAIPAVTSAELNSTTGGLLLKYDATALPLEKLTPLLPLLAQFGDLEKEPPTPERAAKLRALLVKALSLVL